MPESFGRLDTGSGVCLPARFAMAKCAGTFDIAEKFRQWLSFLRDKNLPLIGVTKTEPLRELV